MSPPKSAIFGHGLDVLGSTRSDATGLVTVQLGDNVASDGVAGQATSQNAEWWQHVGLCSRPARPAAGTRAAQVITLTQSDQDICVASRDSRASTIYGSLKDGETAVYASEGQARTIYKADGSITHYTTDDNTATGNGVYLRVTATALQFVAPWGTLEFSKANGLVVRHGDSGAEMALGPVSGLPAPLNVIRSGFRVAAGVCSIKGSTVKIGAGPFLNCATTSAAAAGTAAPSTTVFVST